MKIMALAAIGLAGLTLAACAPRYYDDGRYYGDRHYHRYYGQDAYGRERYPGGGGVYYTDRNSTNGSYYDNPSRERRDYGGRFDRDDY